MIDTSLNYVEYGLTTPKEVVWESFTILNIWEIMKNFNIDKLISSIMTFVEMANTGSKLDKIGFQYKDYSEYKARIDFVCEELDRFNLSMSLLIAKEIQGIIYNELEENPNTKFGRAMFFPEIAGTRFRHFAPKLLSRFEDELSTKTVLILPNNKVSYFKNTKEIFSDIIRGKFPDSIYDLDEACKSFSFSRNTACVFHLMRVMERAVQKIGKKLHIPKVKDKKWNSIIRAVKEAVEKKYQDPKNSNRIKYESILLYLDSIRVVWRNPTMHPKAIYTEEETGEIVLAVKAFLNDLVKTI